MADQPTVREQRSWPALIGWGSLAVFSIVFVWLIRTQLGESWGKREDQAITVVRQFQPAGCPYNLGDLTRVYSIKAREKNAYVGEFQWSAIQKDGPIYEVTLVWKEGNLSRVAVWRVDLKAKSVRAQGKTASSLPVRAQEGKVEG
jgi:hypothetical protein